MAFSIFYSWQSDLPPKINRNFIEDALKKAIKIVGEDISVQEALRDNTIKFDKDTKDVPGKDRPLRWERLRLYVVLGFQIFVVEMFVCCSEQ